jgi:hypothetical protein
MRALDVGNRTGLPQTWIRPNVRDGGSKADLGDRLPNVRFHLSSGHENRTSDGTWRSEVERALSRFALAIFDQRKRHAHSTHAVQPGTVITRQENGASPVRASDDRVHDNQGD